MHRKVVTVLFCDVVGSTALGESVDPETLQSLLARYFARMKRIVESHEGSVEKFIGDAVMAVFGVPQAHEDDALRACRAAMEMRASFPELGIRGRIGVNTGEVVTGTEERLATGDTVNVAARLQQSAQPDEILIGETTLELVRGAVGSEPIRPLELKGKREPVSAHLLLSIRGELERSHESWFVGREREVELIRDAWDRALADGRCELVTVVGEAGIGKSRVVAESLAAVDARIVRGRCLPYGEGITYWAVVEVVKQLNAMPSDPTAAAAIRSLLGESDAGTSAEEIAWAFRKLLAEHAPLVVVFDDIQWGEQTFLDLVEGVVLLSAMAPLLVVCIARPELLARRADWPVVLRLGPLAAEEADQLISPLPSELRERIARAAGGNPLFLTEMLAMAGETADVTVPATLRALLSARLDQLEPAERAVLERGAVEGELFHRGAVQALSPDETQITPRLAVLTRKELIRPDRSQLAGDDGFRFRHLLIRDAAYEALPKATRVELHRRYAEWLADRGGDLVELDELLGYHFEQAAAYAAELGLRISVAGTSQERFDIELLAGDLPAAEAVLREACTALEELGERGFLSTRAASLGLCLALQDRGGEAEPFVELAQQSMTGDEADVVSIVHSARAVVLLSQGALDEAEDQARLALAAMADWDHPNAKAGMLVRLADILQAAGRTDEAIGAYAEALTLYEQKENLVAADRVSRSLALLSHR